ncbi:putative histidinol-phosphatase [Fusarium oxysporum f. sp. albedinis]|nr:putative histidinol-phosphatase [Fusarium oxysporum f. sp. albedinis]
MRQSDQGDAPLSWFRDFVGENESAFTPPSASTTTRLLNAWAPTGRRQLLPPKRLQHPLSGLSLSWLWFWFLGVSTGPILSPPTACCPLHLLDSFRFPQLVLASDIVIGSILHCLDLFHSLKSLRSDIYHIRYCFM